MDNVEISYSQLFNPGFVSAHTRFSSIEEMLNSGGVDTSSVQAFSATPRDQLDQLAKKETPYASWTEFTKAALEPFKAKLVSDLLSSRGVRRRVVR